MAKLKDTEVLTRRVYLNIRQGSEVVTREMPTAQALQVYGEKEVVYMYEPQYSEDRPEPELIKKARKDGALPKETREPGVTAVILA